MKVAEINMRGRPLLVLADRGHGGRFWIRLVEETGEPAGVATAAVPGAVLRPDEITVRTWNENAPLRAPLLATGLFIDTGRREPTGYVQAKVWRLTPDFFQRVEDLRRAA
jgi:hypothetical protein